MSEEDLHGFLQQLNQQGAVYELGSRYSHRKQCLKHLNSLLFELERKGFHGIFPEEHTDAS